MLNILSLVPLSAADIEAINAISSEVSVHDAGGWFDGEYAESWPAASVASYVRGSGRGSRSERDALLADADIVIAGFPFPLDLAARCPKLKWLHQTPAGASNLRRGDIWNSNIVVTTSRGYGESTAIAEYAIAGLLHFVKDFDRAEADRVAQRFERTTYRASAFEQKTLCVIGAGGIGSEVARLAAALNVRCIGTRNTPELSANDDNFEFVAKPQALHELLEQSDFVAVCCQWTPETTHLLNADAFAAMKPSAILINIARGEIVDEAALLDALNRDELRGACLDVYVGEFEAPPPQALWQHPRVLITPHTSTLTDESRTGALALFCENLRRFLKHDPLENEVDWQKGY